jgi:hypothetical protein
MKETGRQGANLAIFRLDKYNASLVKSRFLGQKQPENFNLVSL